LKKYFRILCLLTAVISCGDESENAYTEYKNIEEIKTESIELTNSEDGKFYNPKFSSSGNRIVFTTDTYSGLWYYDLNTKVVNQLNPSIGAGINFDISKVSEKVYFRLQSSSAKGNIKNYSIAEQDIDTKMINILYTSQNTLSAPKALSDGNVAFLMNGEIKIFNKETKNFIDNYTAESIVAFAEGSSIKYKYKNVEKIFTPAQDSMLTWVETSTLNDKIYFNCDGKGTGVYIIESNEIKWIGDYKYLVCSPKSNLISYLYYTADSTNYNSDLYISTESDLKKNNITNSANEIEMFPCWSNDGSKLIYNTADGKIKLTKLIIKSGSNV